MEDEFLTQKRVIIDDVNSFFSNYLVDTTHGFPLKKDHDLMI